MLWEMRGILRNQNGGIRERTAFGKEVEMQEVKYNIVDQKGMDKVHDVVVTVQKVRW